MSNHLIKLVRKNKDWDSDDVERIVRIFEQRGYSISSGDARSAWEDFSESMCAGWMNYDEDYYVFEAAFPYFEEAEL